MLCYVNKVALPCLTLPNVAYFFKRANQRLCLLKKRRSFNVSKQAMIMVHIGPTEGVLISDTVAWYWSKISGDKQ